MPVFNDWPRVYQPPEDALLWRYLTLPKFEDLILSKTLYFCRIDRFSDEFEGSIGLKGAELRDQLLNDLLLPDQSASYSTEILSSRKKFKKFFYANCWHVNQYESVAMWELYLSKNPGVAIRTNLNLMQKAIPQTTVGKIVGGLVNYVDYSSDMFDILGPMDAYFFKRIEYMHEREYRLVYHYLPDKLYPDHVHAMFKAQEEGIMRSIRIDPRAMNFDVDVPEAYRHPIDLNQLTDTILIAPWVSDDVESYIRKMLLDAKVAWKIEKSSLLIDPEF